MERPIPIIDLFAGPGGLGEGFSALRDENGDPVFQIIMSVEKDVQTHRTLRLRAFFRQLCPDGGRVPKAYLAYIGNPTRQNFTALIRGYPEHWSRACQETLCEPLKEGDDTLADEAKRRLDAYGSDSFILIGGPPCQAYSLAGRSRRTRDQKRLQKDEKQTLYKCYLRFIEKLHPEVFVMENVSGILSAKLAHRSIFSMIRRDIDHAGYEVRSLTERNPVRPRDYLVEAERFGIPQARHRVVLLGITKNSNISPALLNEAPSASTVRDALIGIPPIRSDFSRRSRDLTDGWPQYIRRVAQKLMRTEEGKALEEELSAVAAARFPRAQKRMSVKSAAPTKLLRWYRQRLEGFDVLPNHEARTHLAGDLDRYLFCSAFAQKFGRCAKLQDFPAALIPNHKNALDAKVNKDVIFPDRFRVQLYDRCSTTVTSHISKDGHYYIHPDPVQCRSLTVREAARLQTFPDDYFFEGNRTSQYQQVGNAVPPLLARQIAVVVRGCLEQAKALSAPEGEQ